MFRESGEGVDACFTNMPICPLALIKKDNDARNDLANFHSKLGWNPGQ